MVSALADHTSVLVVVPKFAKVCEGVIETISLGSFHAAITNPDLPLFIPTPYAQYSKIIVDPLKNGTSKRDSVGVLVNVITFKFVYWIKRGVPVNVGASKVTVLPSYVNPEFAIAEFVLPFEVNILLSPGFWIVLNPVPEEPLDPELPEDPLEPELPELPLDPEVPEQIPKQVIVIPVSPLTRIGVSVAHTISEKSSPPVGEGSPSGQVVDNVHTVEDIGPYT